MKTQLKKLNRLIKIDCLNPDNYYVITTYEDNIKFQGEFNRDLSKKLTKLFGKGLTDVTGFVEFFKYNIKITLT